MKIKFALLLCYIAVSSGDKVIQDETRYLRPGSVSTIASVSFEAENVEILTEDFLEFPILKNANPRVSVDETQTIIDSEINFYDSTSLSDTTTVIDDETTGDTSSTSETAITTTEEEMTTQDETTTEEATTIEETTIAPLNESESNPGDKRN